MAVEMICTGVLVVIIVLQIRAIFVQFRHLFFLNEQIAAAEKRLRQTLDDWMKL